MSRKDDDLVNRGQNGDFGAFDEIFQQHKQQMYRLARGILHHDKYDDHAVEDIVQDAFVRIITRFDDYRGDSALKTWITTIVTNLSRDTIRRRKVRHHLPLEILDWTRRTPRPIDDRFEEINRRRRVWAAIQKLDDKYRVLIILHYYERFSCNEVAEIVGIKKSIVYSRLHEARNRLPELLKTIEATPNVDFPYA